ncbi:hypothetical protein E2C01_074191 [Portunus trituberculatus]|uniref:Uncharacterized protein n=1 Tax=Portunus trituberculatus TaxID=210409 RepID=A0A5B7IGG6_PORTR|nr:hypothetical protein [Portunus trituberculatus]
MVFFLSRRIQGTSVCRVYTSVFGVRDARRCVACGAYCPRRCGRLASPNHSRDTIILQRSISIMHGRTCVSRQAMTFDAPAPLPSLPRRIPEEDTVPCSGVLTPPRRAAYTHEIPGDR